jgi:hypothetical protein
VGIFNLKIMEPIRSNFNLSSESEKELISHVKSLKPLYVSGEDIIFKSLSKITKEPQVCKNIYYLLQEQHVIGWIKHNSNNDFDIKEIAPGFFSIKNKNYSVEYRIDASRMTFTRCDVEGYMSQQLGVSIFKYLASEYYLLPMQGFSFINGKTSETFMSTNSIEKYFTNIKQTVEIDRYNPQ